MRLAKIVESEKKFTWFIDLDSENECYKAIANDVRDTIRSIELHLKFFENDNICFDMIVSFYKTKVEDKNVRKAYELVISNSIDNRVEKIKYLIFD